MNYISDNRFISKRCKELNLIGRNKESTLNWTNILNSYFSVKDIKMNNSFTKKKFNIVNQLRNQKQKYSEFFTNQNSYHKKI